MIRNLIRIVTNRGGVTREFTHANVHPIRFNGSTVRIDWEYLDDKGRTTGYGGAAYPQADVREITSLEVQ